MEKYIGIEIGGTKLQIILADKRLKILKKARIEVGEEKTAIIIRKKLEILLKGFLEAKDVNGIGVGFGGPVDYRTGIIATSHQIEGWSNFNLKKWLERISGLPVMVENDANAAAFAEANIGCGKAVKNLFYVTLGSGIGGGFILNNQIYHGKIPGESEIGHILLNRSGNTLEDNCSGWAVDNKIKKYIKNNPTSIFAEIVGFDSYSEARFLSSAIKLGDSGAKQILEETAEDLAFGLCHVIHLLHPDIIVLGGGLSLLDKLLIEAVNSYIPKYLLKAFSPWSGLRIAKLSEDVVAIGALLVAQKEFTN